MTWLLWKEYRANRLIVVVGAAILLVPYVVALGLACYGVGPGRGSGPDNLFVAGFFSVILSQLTLALLGGNLIAGERADRSAEFQAYLPIPRVKILAGKLTLALLATLLIWLPNLLILLLLTWGMPEGPRLAEVFEAVWRGGGTIAITGLTFFSIAWLISSFQTSPTFAVCGGLILPYFTLMAIAAVAWLLEYEPEHFDPFMLNVYRATCLVLAPLCFTLGTWLFLRRVEP
jgi:ABC-type transport system involved in multi-copper enzyme maturation permease subunit